MECLLFHDKSLDQITIQKNKVLFNYLRFHRSFIEASQEYYKSMFEPSAEKDELLMNVIDYFTEKWNEQKSDGRSGEKKQFRYKNIEFVNKTLNGFKTGKDQKEYEYLDYRNAKTHKLRKEIMKNGKTEIIHNKRKLSEFINLINMLDSDDKKVELFKKHVYFNSEFMTSKAELREMIFVVSMHEEILKLNDKELIDISQIYVDQFSFIEQDPKTLIFNILSRLESREDNVRQFSASNNLLLLHSYKKKDIERELFIPEKYYRIQYFWIIKDTPYLLIMTDKDYSPTKIHLISSKTKQHLGEIDLKECMFHDDVLRMEIVIYDNYESLAAYNKIFQLNGKVYFAENKTFFSINFQNEISIIHEFDEYINQLFILNAKNFAFVLDKKIVLLNIDEMSIQIQQIEFSTYYFVLGSTKSTRFVHSASHLPIRNFKILTYDKQITKNPIKIFQFNNEVKKLELFCEFEIDIACKDEYLFVIDESFLINDNKFPNLEMIRFAIITTEDVLKVIEAKKNNEYSIVAEFKEAFSLFDDELFELEPDCFFENIIIVKMEKKYQQKEAGIYDIGKYFLHFKFCNKK
jgi:hypothetical protein